MDGPSWSAERLAGCHPGALIKLEKQDAWLS